MTTDPSRSYPHRALWRKLRRRCFLDGSTLFVGALVLPSALCALAWLSHGPLSRWLVVCFGILWFVISMFGMLAMSIGLMVARRQDKVAPANQFALLWYILVNAVTMIALLFGRVDWAFYLTFGLTGLSGIWSGQATVRSFALPLLIRAALCLAFAAHAVWLLIPLLVLHYLPSRGRPALTELVRHRPTRTEYLAKSREQCATGGG